VPAPLSGRIDAMLAIADAADEPTTRNELIAALIYAAPLDPEQIAMRLKAYRMAKVSDAFVPGQPREVFLRPLRRQGPRTTLSAAPRSSASDRTRPEIAPGQPLRHASPYRLGPTIPRPLDRQLDLLVGQTEEVGERTSRKELAAALILAAPTSEEDVGELLRRYRRAEVRPIRGVARRGRGRPRRGV
jgi:hypothetical protein